METHFDTLTIGGFRGIRDLHLEGLGAVNLLVGVNNAGKTSVLEALALCSSPLEPGDWLRLVRWRGMSPPFSRMEAVRWLFPCGKGASPDVSGPAEDVAIATKTGGGVSRITAHYTELESQEPPAWASEQLSEGNGNSPLELDAEFPAPAAAPGPAAYRYAAINVCVEGPPSSGLLQELSASRTESEFEVWERFPRRGRPRAGQCFPCKTITPFAHVLADELVRNLSLVLLSGPEDVRNPVVSMLHAIDPDVERLTILALHGPAALYVSHRRLGPVPIYALGDGLRRALTLALAVYEARGGILLVDEIETAIHTTALTKLYQWLVRQCRENHVQLFVTTHSLEAIDTLVEAAQEETEVALTAFRLSQRDGHTEALRLEGRRLARLRFDLGQEVR